MIVSDMILLDHYHFRNFIYYFFIFVGILNHHFLYYHS